MSSEIDIRRLERLTVTPPPDSPDRVRNYIVVEVQTRQRHDEENRGTMKRLRAEADLVASGAAADRIKAENHPEWTIEYVGFVTPAMRMTCKYEINPMPNCECADPWCGCREKNENVQPKAEPIVPCGCGDEGQHVAGPRCTPISRLDSRFLFKPTTVRRRVGVLREPDIIEKCQRDPEIDQKYHALVDDVRNAFRSAFRLEPERETDEDGMRRASERIIETTAKSEEAARLIIGEARAYLATKREWPTCAKRCGVNLKVFGVMTDHTPAPRRASIAMECPACGEIERHHFDITERAERALKECGGSI